MGARVGQLWGFVHLLGFLRPISADSVGLQIGLCEAIQSTIYPRSNHRFSPRATFAPTSPPALPALLGRYVNGGLTLGAGALVFTDRSLARLPVGEHIRSHPFFRHPISETPFQTDADAGLFAHPYPRLPPPIPSSPSCPLTACGKTLTVRAGGLYSVVADFGGFQMVAVAQLA